MSPIFQPFQVDYYNAQEGEPLDFFIYVPHGAPPEEFLDQHTSLEDALIITRGDFIKICRMEADTFTPELASVTAKMLTEEGYGGAVMEVLFPRELIDANRVPEHALHPVFDFKTHSDLKKIFLDYHAAALFQREQLIEALSDLGVFLDLPTMRQGPTDMDCKNPDFSSHAEIVDYYGRRTRTLEQLNPIEPRTTCLVTRPVDPLLPFVANPIFLKNMIAAFDQYRINWNNDVYRFLPHILGGTHSHHYDQGLAIDVVKTDLCVIPHLGRLDLANLQPDPNKMLRYVECLVQAIMQTVEENRCSIQSLPLGLHL